MKPLKIILAINYVDYKDPKKKRWQEIAVDVLCKNAPSNIMLVSMNYPEDQVVLPNRFHVFKGLSRNSKNEIGNNRPLPYIHEILESCAKLKCDVLGYINSDILLNENFFKQFSNDIDAYVFYKKDIEDVNSHRLNAGKFRIIWDNPDGVDGFFFSKTWWLKNAHLFPKNLIIGETEWDTCYNSIIQVNCERYLLKRSLFHVYHDRIWTKDSSGAKNNIAIWEDIKQKYGLPKFIPETVK